jgi:MinD-like ATPase involved in chromosome partitioning or flagellar assembly
LKIALVTHDESLVQHFMLEASAKSYEIEHFTVSNDIFISGNHRSWDIIVVSERMLNQSGLFEFGEKVKESFVRCKVMLLLSTGTDSSEAVIKYCLANGFKYLYEELTVTATVKGIYDVMEGNHSISRAGPKRIVAFIGSTPNIGTTLTAFGTAVRLAEETNQTIAYFCLNLKSSKIHRYLAIEDPPVTLDGIRAELKSQALTRERLIQHCFKIKTIPNLYVLFGNMLREQAEFFTPEDIDHLLETAAKSFDLCVIEVNAYWDNAATICGALQAGMRIVVTTGEVGHFQEDIHRWIKSVSGIFGLQASAFDIFITQKENGSISSGIRTKDIRKETSMNVIGEMRRHPQAADYLNRGAIVDLFKNDLTMISDLSGLTNTIAALYGLERRMEAEKERWYSKFLPRTSATQGG